MDSAYPVWLLQKLSCQGKPGMTLVLYHNTNKLIGDDNEFLYSSFRGILGDTGIGQTNWAQLLWSKIGRNLDLAADFAVDPHSHGDRRSLQSGLIKRRP